MCVVKFLPRAEKDFDGLSDDLQDEVIAKAEMLAEFPYLGYKMEKAFAAYRCLLVGRRRYRLIYKVKSVKLIEIAYIRHCRRQLGLRLL